MGEQGADRMEALVPVVHRKLSVVWLAAAGVAIVSGTTMVIVGGPAGVSSPVTMRAGLFVGGALLSAFASFLVPSRLQLEPRADSALVAGLPELADGVVARDSRALCLATLYQRAYLTLAFCYVPAFLGCVFLGLWQPRWLGAALVGMSVLLLAVRFPSLRNWLLAVQSAAAVEQAHRAGAGRATILPAHERRSCAPRWTDG